MDTIGTIEPETAHQEQEPASEPKMPSVATFKEIVNRHCKKWGTETVEGLCEVQTLELILELAPYFA